MTTDDIINDILEREQEGTPPYLVPGDAGGRTSWGISEVHHPEAWVNGPPTRLQAFAIYEAEYVAPFAALDVDDMLRATLVDDAVLSGVSAAIKRLQAVLGIDMDGVIGAVTKRLAALQDPDILLTRYTCERVIRLTRLVQKRTSDLPFLTGWVSRALLFLPHRGK